MMIQHPPHLWTVFCFILENYQSICNVEWVSSVLYLFQCVTFSSVMLRCCLSFMHHHHVLSLFSYFYITIKWQLHGQPRLQLQVLNRGRTLMPSYPSEAKRSSKVSSPLLFCLYRQLWRYNLWTLALTCLLTILNHSSSGQTIGSLSHMSL